MKYKFTIDEVIAKTAENGQFYFAADELSGYLLVFDEIDRALIKMVKKTRAKLKFDIFVEDLPEPGWVGGIEVLIRPEYHKFIKNEGRTSDEDILLLMKLAGVKKITFKAANREEE